MLPTNAQAMDAMAIRGRNAANTMNTNAKSARTKAVKANAFAMPITVLSAGAPATTCGAEYGIQTAWRHALHKPKLIVPAGVPRVPGTVTVHCAEEAATTMKMKDTM